MKTTLAGNEARYELYNLRDDLSETKNLAAQMPDEVKELDALIDGFLADTGALIPKPNPNYRMPTLAPGLAKKAADPLQGWVPKQCKAVLADGARRVEAEGRAPFLGTVQVKHSGPATLKLHIRTSAGGGGKMQWRTADQETFPANGQAVSFELKPVATGRTSPSNCPCKGSWSTFAFTSQPIKRRWKSRPRNTSPPIPSSRCVTGTSAPRNNPTPLEPPSNLCAPSIVSSSSPYSPTCSLPPPPSG